jgi:hypothetical protein
MDNLEISLSCILQLSLAELNIVFPYCCSFFILILFSIKFLFLEFKPAESPSNELLLDESLSSKLIEFLYLGLFAKFIIFIFLLLLLIGGLEVDTLLLNFIFFILLSFT